MKRIPKTTQAPETDAPNAPPPETPYPVVEHYASAEDWVTEDLTVIRPPIDSGLIPLYTTKPGEGDYRVFLAIVDEYGNAKHVDFVISSRAHQHLRERSSWDQYFYPALMKVGA